MPKSWRHPTPFSCQGRHHRPHWRRNAPSESSTQTCTRVDTLPGAVLMPRNGLKRTTCRHAVRILLRLLMVRWVVGSILHGVDPLSYFSFQPVLHDWCNKGRGMCYPVCGMVHIKEPLLLIDKSSPCGDSGFTLSLSEWSLTPECLTPYNHR